MDKVYFQNKFVGYMKCRLSRCHMLSRKEFMISESSIVQSLFDLATFYEVCLKSFVEILFEALRQEKTISLFLYR